MSLRINGECRARTVDEARAQAFIDVETALGYQPEPQDHPYIWVWGDVTLEYISDDSFDSPSGQAVSGVVQPYLYRRD